MKESNKMIFGSFFLLMRKCLPGFIYIVYLIGALELAFIENIIKHYSEIITIEKWSVDISTTKQCKLEKEYSGP